MNLNHISIEWRLALPWIAVTVLSALVAGAYPAESWAAAQIRALAQAVATGAGVTAALEIFATKKLVDTAGAEIAARVMASHLPLEFSERIREVVHRIHLVRENWSAEYEIEPSGESGMTRVIVHLRYTVRNHSGRTRRYRPHLSEDAFYRPAITHLEITHGGKSVPTGIESRVNPDTGATFVDGPWLKLMAKGRDRSACTVYWRFEMTAPDKCTHVQAFGGPTINPEIRLIRSAGYVFSASRGRAGAVTASTWHYPHAYLDGQHERVWWEKANA